MGLTQLLPKDLADQLQEPEKLVKAEFDGPMPRPRVLCAEGEWPLVARAMYERGLVEEIDEIPAVDNIPVVNGAFGVTKQGKSIDTGEDVLRLIMDLRPWGTYLPEDCGGRRPGAAHQRRRSHSRVLSFSPSPSVGTLHGHREEGEKIRFGIAWRDWRHAGTPGITHGLA